MAENLFYYFLALNLAAVFILVCGIIATELRRTQLRREQQRARAAYSELIRLRAHKSTARHGPMEPQGGDFPQAFQEDTLDLIKQLQTELNWRVVELEREL